MYFSYEAEKENYKTGDIERKKKIIEGCKEIELMIYNNDFGKKDVQITATKKHKIIIVKVVLNGKRVKIIHI
jgi:hypothetical protein